MNQITRDLSIHLRSKIQQDIKDFAAMANVANIPFEDAMMVILVDGLLGIFTEVAVKMNMPKELALETLESLFDAFKEELNRSAA